MSYGDAERLEEPVREGHSNQVPTATVSVSPNETGPALVRDADPAAAKVLSVDPGPDPGFELLESEEDVPPNDVREFECRMTSLEVERGSDQ